MKESTDKSLPRKESPDDARSYQSYRSSGRSSKTNKSLSYYLKKSKRVQEALKRTIESLSQDYEAHKAEISDIMSQKSKDENKSRSRTETREISTQTDSEEERFIDHLFRPVPEVMYAPKAASRAKPRKTIKKEIWNFPSREVTVG